MLGPSMKLRGRAAALPTNQCLDFYEAKKSDGMRRVLPLLGILGSPLLECVGRDWLARQVRLAEVQAA